MMNLAMVVAISGLTLGAPGDGQAGEQAGTGVRLVSGGEPACAIIYPAEGEAWRNLAGQVGEAIVSLGGAKVQTSARHARPCRSDSARSGRICAVSA